ncbi:Putative phage regulatory protein [Enterobacter cancerogenus]|nr:Putative phage regulatory protein [Enterobacter cancerogenus]
MLLNPAGLLLLLIIQRENKHMNTKTSVAPATTLLNADDPLIDMHFITAYTNMTDKWFYKLIAENQFPKPIKLGRSSRWRKSEVEAWMQERMTESRSS